MAIKDSGNRICKYCWGSFKEKDVIKLPKGGGNVCKNCQERL